MVPSYLVFGFLVGLAANKWSLHSIISSTFGFDTSTGWDSIPHNASRALVSVSLDTVMVGEVDELEEDILS